MTQMSTDEPSPFAKGLGEKKQMIADICDHPYLPVGRCKKRSFNSRSVIICEY